jgi:hypothetical protein
MDLYKAIAELYHLPRQVNEAIASLEALEKSMPDNTSAPSPMPKLR